MQTSIKFANNAEAFLEESITDASTILYVADKSTAVFPKLDSDKGQYFTLLIYDAADNGRYEYMKCTALTDTTFTVERGQEGTIAKAFPANSRIIHPLSAESLDNVQIESRIVRTHAEPDTKYGGSTGLLFGHAKLTDDFELGTTSVESVCCSPYALHQAVLRLLALPKEHLFTTSASWTCPESGTYTITCVGGGGRGGAGGTGTSTYSSWSCGKEGTGTCSSCAATGAGGGGGGGAGQMTSAVVSCTKGTSYQIIVGGPGGQSIFGGNLIVALAGGNGGNGGVPGGGGGGISYGTAAGSGGAGGYEHKSGGSFSGASCTANGGGGGAGGQSNQGTYGNGGNGGSGGRGSTNGNGGGAGGVNGTQGYIKIAYPLGK